MRIATSSTRGDRSQPGWLRIAAMALALALVAVACGTDDDTDPGGTTAATGADATEDTGTDDGATEDGDDGEAAESVGSLSLGVPGIPPIFGTMVMFVASEEGFFDQHGVDVEVRPMQTGADAIRAVVSGEIDASFSPTGLAVQLGATEAQDLRLLWGMPNVDWIVASTNPDVQSCEDLEGQTIGVDSVGGARFIVLSNIMRSCDLDLQGGDANTADFPGAPMIQALASGQLETGVVHLDEFAIIDDLTGGEVHEVVRQLEVNPDAHFAVVDALEGTIDENREAFVRMLAGVIEAARFMSDTANLDRVAEIATESGQTAEQARNSVEMLLEIDFWPTDSCGLDEDKLQANIDTQVRVGNFEESQAPDLDTFLLTELCDEAMALVDAAA
jgi:NitT/TauT family transport system substrate-binding protein